MLSILILEDDVRQQNWARTRLSEHNLTVVETEEAFNTFDPLEFDYILTDLFIGKNPVGTQVIEQLLPQIDHGKLKGIALVSNWEHHVAIFTHELLAMPYELGKLGSNYGRIAADMHHGRIPKLENAPTNFVHTLDMDIAYYHHFLAPNAEIFDGKTEFDKQTILRSLRLATESDERMRGFLLKHINRELPAIKVPDEDREQFQHRPQAYAVAKLGWTNLKPWREVLELLIRDVRTVQQAD